MQHLDVVRMNSKNIVNRKRFCFTDLISVVFVFSTFRSLFTARRLRILLVCSSLSGSCRISCLLADFDAQDIRTRVEFFQLMLSFKLMNFKSLPKFGKIWFATYPKRRTDVTPQRWRSRGHGLGSGHPE